MIIILDGRIVFIVRCNYKSLQLNCSTISDFIRKVNIFTIKLLLSKRNFQVVLFLNINMQGARKVIRQIRKFIKITDTIF